MGPLILALLAFAFGVAVVMAIYMAITKVPGMMAQRRLNERLQGISQAPDEEVEEKTLLVKVQHVGPMPGIDRMLGGTTRGSALGRWIDQSGMQASISGVLLISLVLAAALGLLGMLLARANWGILLGGLIGFGLPFFVLKTKRARRLRAFEEQFPEGLDLISRALKAGHAFTTGIDMVGTEMPKPVGPEFRNLYDHQNFGMPMPDALKAFSDRVPVLDARFFVTAVLIQRESGGNLSEVLDNLAGVIRERFRVKRQMRVLSAHGRITGWILAALPPVLGLVLMSVNPEHRRTMLGDPLGIQMLVGAVIMQIIGTLIIRKIVNVEY
jgi:tight adherence protein B